MFNYHSSIWVYIICVRFNSHTLLDLCCSSQCIGFQCYPTAVPFVLLGLSDFGFRSKCHHGTMANASTTALELHNMEALFATKIISFNTTCNHTSARLAESLSDIFSQRHAKHRINHFMNAAFCLLRFQQVIMMASCTMPVSDSAVYSLHLL